MEASVLVRVALALLFFYVTPAFADSDSAASVYGSHPGYLFNVADERNRREIEMVLLEPPKDKKPDLRKVIFNDQLSKEFQDQYRIKFGQTAAEQVINNPARDEQYTYYSSSVNTKDYQTYQHQFGDYMFRRLTEYHFDKWAKNDPQFRPVYKMKDKISNLNVEMKKGYKLKWKYNFAGPSMEANLENPYDVQTRVQALMSGLVSKPSNVIYTLGYRFTPRVSGQALYRQTENLVQLVGTRSLTKKLSVSLTGSSGKIPDNLEVHQDLILVGLSYSD